MPSIERSRPTAAPRARVWDLVADPHNMPRWWPETTRVEAVEGKPGARRSRFTQVLKTSRGSSVRADFRLVESTDGSRLRWEQQIEGTPFEKFLTSSGLEVRIDDSGGESLVSLIAERGLRGMSRLGSPMMRRGTRQLLDQALDGIELALVGER